MAAFLFLLLSFYLVDGYRPSAEAACFRTAWHPDIDLTSFDVSAGVGNQVASTVRTGTEADAAAKFQHTRVGGDNAASDSVSHGRSALQAISCSCERTSAGRFRRHCLFNKLFRFVVHCRRLGYHIVNCYL